jgi:hypothetical protein
MGAANSRRADPAGTGSPEVPAPSAVTAQPTNLPTLPVVDLIGLRFSLHHLRIVGYGLLAVWLAELAGMLSEPDFSQIGSRLHFISQFLDLSPILLVAIGLIAFQGGLRRRALETLFLPLLLALLPLLSAVHLFLAPATVANAFTLIQKQEASGMSQIVIIDRQLDRATQILRESDSIDSLLQGLQRIPGLQVRVPAKVSMREVRSEVRRSLELERKRLRSKIRENLSSTRGAFQRRALANAALALLMGLVLWAIHRGTMREMEQAIPFLDWVLLHGELNQNPQVLQELLRFQRACVALGWFALLEQALGLMRRVIHPQPEEALAVGSLEELEAEPPPPYPPPFVPDQLSIPPLGLPPRLAFLNDLPGSLPKSLEDEPDDEVFAQAFAQLEPVEPPLTFWQRRRGDRDRKRARDALRRMGESSILGAFLANPSSISGAASQDPGDPAERRARLRDVQRSRKALRRMANPAVLGILGDGPPPPPQPRLRPPTGPLSRLRRWFVTHL